MAHHVHDVTLSIENYTTPGDVTLRGPAEDLGVLGSGGELGRLHIDHQRPVVGADDKEVGHMPPDG